MTTSTSNAQFTLLSSKGQQFQLPLIHALHSITLACLIPSQTYQCILPEVCDDSAISFCVRYLELLHCHPLSEADLLQSNDLHEFRKLVDDLEYHQIMSVLSTSQCLKIDQAQDILQKLLKERKLKLENDNPIEERRRMIEQFMKQSASHSRSDNTIRLSSNCDFPINPQSVQVDEGPSFSLISHEQHRHQLPKSVARWSPNLNRLITSGVDTLPLPECDDWSIQLAIQFLKLLVTTPLVFRSGPTTVTSSISSRVPSSYAQLFDDQINLNDGSDDRLYKICEALELINMKLVVSLKVSRLMFSESLGNHSNKSGWLYAEARPAENTQL